MSTNALRFMSLLFTALVTGASLAHLLELPNKIKQPGPDYLVVQQIYRGWSHFGVVLLGAIVTNLALTIALRNRRAAFWFAFSAFILVTATLAIFLVWTYPANQATNNWTVVPGNWQQLRTQWEYSHAANALLTFAAFCSVVVAALKSKAQTPAPRF